MTASSCTARSKSTPKWHAVSASSGKEKAAQASLPTAKAAQLPGIESSL
jgi:hypothetical protein